MAEFVASYAAERFPTDVLDRARYFLLDYIGTALAGSRTESSAAVQAFVDEFAPGDATVIGRSRTAHPSYAALANGAASHSIEMDDTHREGSIHLGATVFSALIAASEVRPASGRELLVAAVMGYEVAARLAMALDPAQHYARGFHPTATCGALGAAAAVARLWRLDPEQTTHALGVAGSQASGLMEFLATGAWSKRMHPGWAAQSGLVAAGLARHGFTGPASVIEGSAGFLRAFSAAPRPERVTGGLGDSWEILRTSVKAHTCCRYMQAPIDAVLALRRDHAFAADDVERVTLGILSVAVPIICEPEAKKLAPGSIVDAQFSMPFGAAVAMLHGRASLAEFTPDVFTAPPVRDLMRRVAYATDPELDRHYPREWPAWALVELRDGRKLHAHVPYPKGDPENPLTWPELIDKHRSLGRDVLDPARLDEIVTRVRAIDAAPDVRALWRLCRAA